MSPFVLTMVVAAPGLAFAGWLWRRRAWGALTAYLAATAGLIAVAMLIGYQDYEEPPVEQGITLDWDQGTHLWLFALLGMIVSDWLALIWGAVYWFRRRGIAPAHRTRADRRREARAAAVARATRGMTK
jgi:hypothetical protein